jgi:hypothetical protein
VVGGPHRAAWVASAEVEEVLFARPRWITAGRGGTTLVFGTTMAGRLLLVVTLDETVWRSLSRRER